EEQLIDLKELNHIRIAKEERVLEGDAGKEKVIDKLWLSLIGNSAKSSDIQLEFYNGDENMGLMGEPLLIQKWHDRLSVALKLYKARPNRAETQQQPDLAH